jgi:hypothetical protein
MRQKIPGITLADEERSEFCTLNADESDGTPGEILNPRKYRKGNRLVTAPDHRGVRPRCGCEETLVDRYPSALNQKTDVFRD